MNIYSGFLKAFAIVILCVGLFACSETSAPEVDEDQKKFEAAQKRLEEESKEIQAKAKIKREFEEKNCNGLTYVECQKLMREAGLVKGKSLY